MIRAAIVALALALVAPATALADGELVQVTGKPEVYRIVGSAPLWIGTCAFIPPNGVCDNSNVNQVPNLDAYRQYPADNATARAYEGPAVYRFAGGAPLWISSCEYAPGCNTIVVDLNALTHLGHTRQYPADGTVVENVDDGGKYRFAGGAPLLVRCDLGPGCSNVVRVDGNTFAASGSQPPMAARMRQYPADGTTVQNIEDGAYYRFAGGSPLPLSGCAGCAAQPIDALSLRLAGTATPALPHMAARPADGTYLTTGAATYRVAGGAALPLTSCTPLGGCPGAVSVDAGTISSLGGGRLLATPKDGTVLRGLPSKRTWEIVGGKRRETFIAGLGGIEVDDGAIDLIPIEAPPPAPPAPAVFKPVISSGYKVFRRYTRFTSLKVRDAPAGSVVTVACTGKRKGCPFKKQKYHRLKGSSLNVYARWFKKAKLKRGATVTVRVSGPTGARKQQTFKIRSRKLPVRTTRCSAPGAKLSRCTT